MEDTSHHKKKQQASKKPTPPHLSDVVQQKKTTTAKFGTFFRSKSPLHDNKHDMKMQEEEDNDHHHHHVDDDEDDFDFNVEPISPTSPDEGAAENWKKVKANTVTISPETATKVEEIAKKLAVMKRAARFKTKPATHRLLAAARKIQAINALRTGDIHYGDLNEAPRPDEVAEVATASPHDMFDESNLLNDEKPISPKLIHRRSSDKHTVSPLLLLLSLSLSLSLISSLAEGKP
jgi:hypothetical protein